MHEINSDIMLLGQQTWVDWWRQTARVMASCWLSLGDAIFSRPRLPARWKGYGLSEAAPFQRHRCHSNSLWGCFQHLCKVTERISADVLEKKHNICNVSIHTCIMLMGRERERKIQCMTAVFKFWLWFPCRTEQCDNTLCSADVLGLLWHL